ncbi:MAG: diaminopimelate decarboxylase [Clostridium sp.]|nr:diaminopimelate decarboxylase [Clostridium sp.]
MIRDKYSLPIDSFADRPTPFYYYDLQLLHDTLCAVKENLPANGHMHYALKANSNPRVLQMIASHGIGADCVSGGEISTAIANGFAPASIAYSGVGKTNREIALALRVGIGCFNIESIEELYIMNEIAVQMNKTAPIALRVNPNIDAHTHHYITTGLSENKFGIDLRMLDQALDTARVLPGLKLMGLHFHIGSQITINEPFVLLCERVREIVEKCKVKGIDIEHINVGGGLGIDYDDPIGHPIPDFKAYFDCFKQGLAPLKGKQLHFELGRAIVGQCGSLISRVIYVKRGISKQFLIIDAGMNDLIRPALYEACHLIENLTSFAPNEVYDVVGPICETADTFAEDYSLPSARRGDLIAIRSAGAYGESMSSTYNIRKLISTYSY